jgi:hypothetical protein
MLLEAFQGRQADRIARVVAEHQPMPGASLVRPAQPLPEVAQAPEQVGMGLEPEGQDRDGLRVDPAPIPQLGLASPGLPGGC